MKNRGVVSISIIFFLTTLVAGYFGYNNVYKPYKATNILKEKEVEAFKSIEKMKTDKIVNFNPIIPKYIPKGYYLDTKIGPYRDESSFLLTYKDSKEMRIDIFEENLTPERKARFFKDQEIFPLPIKQLKNGVSAFVTNSGEVTGKDKASGLEISIAMIEYKFLINNIKIQVSTANTATVKDIENIANSMIE